MVYEIIIIHYKRTCTTAPVDTEVKICVLFGSKWTSLENDEGIIGAHAMAMVARK